MITLVLSVVQHGPSGELLRIGRKNGLGVLAQRADTVSTRQAPRTVVEAPCQPSQGFVIGGYTRGTHGFDAIIIGFYRGKELVYAARVRAGFVLAARKEVFTRIKDLKLDDCPFLNLPEEAVGR